MRTIRVTGRGELKLRPDTTGVTLSLEGTEPEYGDAERELAALREMGLDGIEAHYQANTPAEDAAFTDIAARVGLLVTAGSDFHGKNKPTISLGMEVEEGFIAPFLERLHAAP